MTLCFSKQSQFSPSIFLCSVSLLRQFVSAGRARPPHGTVRIGVEKVPAQQIVYLRFNLQLRWSGHTAALFHRGDWRREWNVYTSFIINRPVSDIKYLQFIWMMHLWCDWVVLYWKAHCLCSTSNKALQNVLNHNMCSQQSVIKHNKTEKSVIKHNKVWLNTTKHKVWSDTTTNNKVWSNTTKCDQTQQKTLSDTTLRPQYLYCVWEHVVVDLLLCLKAHCCVVMWLKAHFVFVGTLLCVSWLRTLCCLGLQGTFLCCFVYYGMLCYIWRWVTVLHFRALCSAQKFRAGNVFERSFLCSPRLHLLKQ